MGSRQKNSRIKDRLLTANCILSFSLRSADCTLSFSLRKMSYSLDIKTRARELFVEQGMTFEEVSGDTGISISQLKKWGKEGSWTEERDSFERDYMELHSKLQKVKLKLVNDALTDARPDKIFALAGIMRIGNSRKAKQVGEDRAGIFLEFMGELLAFLKEQDPESLRYLEPHIRNFANEVKAGDRRQLTADGGPRSLVDGQP